MFNQRQYKDILIVDHDEERVSRYESWLRDSGYSWDRAENGKFGFRMSNTCDYGIVIAELKTPDWDAIDMIISMDVIDPKQKVFVISPELSKNDEECLLDFEAVLSYGERPSSREDLLLLVRKCLDYVKTTSN